MFIPSLSRGETPSAIEIAAMIRTALDDSDKRSGAGAPWAKLKYDRQIIAIAKARQVSAVYSDDADVHRLGQLAGVTVIGFAELDLPPEDPQLKMPLEDAENAQRDEGQESPIAEDSSEDEDVEGDGPEL